MLEQFFQNIPEFLSDAFIDTIKLIPSLLVIFVLIEVFENFFAHKIANIVSFSKKLGPILGAFLAIIPQCGFSVIMTTLYIKKYITTGTLISVYIATSDEAIPILLANPAEIHTVIKIILIKLVLAIIAGYLTDLFIKSKLHKCYQEAKPCSHLKSFQPEKGCCSHELNENKIKNIILHPIKHTVIISLFILIICIGLNYTLNLFHESSLSHFAGQNLILQNAIFALFGLIPNCAVSVLIIMMYLKGIIAFSSVIAGLTTNAGLGLIILFTEKESLKSFLIIISILIISGLSAGIALNIFGNILP